MGIEAFGVTIRLIDPAASDAVRRFLERLDHVKLARKDGIPGFEVFVGEYNDSVHLIEIQILKNATTNECTIGVRFSLCSYISIDAIFTDFVLDVIAIAEADVYLMTSALKQRTHYSPGDEQWLRAALPDEVVSMREYWQRQFGKKQGIVRVKDSFSFVGLR